MVLAEADQATNSTEGLPPSLAIAEGNWLSLEPPNGFTCTYCSRAFLSPHALGGHQNAHRKEKMEERRLFAEARNVSLSMAVISPQPLRMIVPSSVLENGVFLPTHYPHHHCPTGALEMQYEHRNYKEKKVMKLLECMKKRGSRGRAPRRNPRRNLKSKGLDGQASSTGSRVAVVRDLDLELRLWYDRL